MAVNFLNPLEVLAKLPTPTEVISGLMEMPKVLSDRELFAAHMSYRLAQVVSVAVRQAATQEDWVAETALEHVGRIVDVIVPIMGQKHTLRWQIEPVDILVAQRIEPEPDANTITASPANVTLTVMPSVYDDVFDQWPPEIAKIMRHVHISGESALADWVSRLVKILRPDVWAQLAAIIGATPAGWVQHGAERAKRDVQNFAEKAQSRLLDGGVTGEAVAIRHEALHRWSDQIHQVRQGVDTLAQRIARLQKAAAAPTSGHAQKAGS